MKVNKKVNKPGKESVFFNGKQPFSAKLLLILIWMFLSISMLYAGKWEIDHPEPGIAVLRNENGKFKGPRKSVLHINSNVIHARKTFPLKCLPDGVLKRARRAALRIFCAVHDYSWAKNKDGKTDGLTEELGVLINGHEMILKMNDPRFPAKTSKASPLHFKWVDLEFPPSWLSSGKLVVELFKRPTATRNDYFYPGIDTEVPNTDSLVSVNRGRIWTDNWGNLKNKRGEYMMRLVLWESGPKLAGKPGSDFSTAFETGQSQLKLFGNTKVSNGILSMDGSSGTAAEIPGGEKLNVTENGITMVAVVRFRDPVTGGAKQNRDMMIFHKDKAFFLGRTGNRYNFSLSCNGKRWSQALVSGRTPLPGEWTHLAGVIEKVNDAAQGLTGYRLLIYVNGELRQQKMIRYVSIDSSNCPLQIGCGLKGYDFNGEFSEIGFYNRALNPAEISRMAANSKYVKTLPPGSFEITSELEKSFLKLEAKTQTSHGRWLINALKRAALTGDKRKKLYTLILLTAEKLGLNGTPEDMVRKFNAAQDAFSLYSSDQALLLMVRNSGVCSFPLAGFYDRKAQTPVFADRTMEWSFQYFNSAGKTAALSSFDSGFPYSIKVIKTKPGTTEFEINWNNRDFLVKSQIIFSGSRLETDMAVTSRNPGFTLTEVIFPSWRFAQRSGNNDTLVYPHMSGILTKNPTRGFDINKTYPSSRVTMQFSGYYDDSGSGIYFAYEDPLARVKDYSVCGRINQLFVKWFNPVAYHAAKSGGNSWRMSGKAVIELYKGKWFEAGRLYKRFLANHAKWWIKDLPRTSTPQWYRNNAMWICASSGRRAAQELLYLHKYFEIPLTVSWVYWYTLTNGDHPEFHNRPGSAEYVKMLQKAGMHVEAYFNPRLWGYCPKRLSDWRKTAGMLAAVKNRNGEPVFERYGKCNYAVICPASSLAQKWISRETRRIAGYGYDSIYHDQLPCSFPKLCFDRHHGHLMNDSSSWLEHGYWPLYKKVRHECAAISSQIAHNGEEASDPYLKCIDGYMVWRWVDKNHVPLFQSIYAGRIQFTGRMYDAHSKTPGGYKSFFPKVAEQLIYGEQIGWFHLNDLRYASPRRSYAKKMAHLRSALVGFFNASDMLSPLSFEPSVPKLSSNWSVLGGKRLIKTDQVLHSVWKRLEDGKVMILFVNTVNQDVTVKPILPTGLPGNLAVCREGTSEPEFISLKKQNALPPVKLKPYGSEVWVFSSHKDKSPELIKITETLKRIAGFTDPGKILELPQNFKAKNCFAVKTGEWIAPVRSSWMKKCLMPKYPSLGFDQDRWIQAEPGGKIFWGRIDFGKNNASKIEIMVAADPSRAGGKISFYDAETKTILAEGVVPVTGDWFDFKILSLPLKSKLSGKHDIMTEFTGGCNIRNWRIVE